MKLETSPVTTTTTHRGYMRIVLKLGMAVSLLSCVLFTANRSNAALSSFDCSEMLRDCNGAVNTCDVTLNSAVCDGFPNIMDANDWFQTCRESGDNDLEVNGTALCSGV